MVAKSKQSMYRLLVLKIGAGDVPSQDVYSATSAMSLVNSLHDQGYDVDKLDKFEHHGAEGDNVEYYSVLFLMKLRD